jgi:cell division protein FtsI (penicillin-binding protein 3)
METVATEGYLKALVGIPGYRVGTKTGTAEVAVNGVYTSQRTFSVVGLAPAEDPKYVVLVSMRNPHHTYSTAVAAPIFRKIMEQTLKTYRVTPSTQPASNPPATW